MIRRKYFFLLLCIPFVPMIFYKEHVIQFMKEKSNPETLWGQTISTQGSLKPRIQDVWSRTPYLKGDEAKPSTLSQHQRTTNATSKVLLSRSLHTTQRMKRNFPDVWTSTPYLKVDKPKPSTTPQRKHTSNARSTILPQRSSNTTQTSKPKVPVPSGNFTFKLGPTSPYYKELPLSDQVGKNLSLDITVVSAYFLLPSFPKGSKTAMRKPGHYVNWMKAFAWIVNPLLIYTDDEKICNSLKKMLADTNRTSSKVILIRREDLWSFNQIHVIREIFKQKKYPVHYPNTVIPAYNCLTHAKLELLKLSIEKNYFHTKYFIWVDIGYFRYSVHSDFGLHIPKTFDDRRVGLTHVGSLKPGVSLQDAISHNRNYIAGGCFLGRVDVLLIFCNEYLDFLREAIKQKWVGVEQQMLYAMYSRNKKPKTSLQLCSPGWFCMGRLAVKAWAIKQNQL